MELPKILERVESKDDFSIWGSVLDFISRKKSYIFAYLVLSLGSPLKEVLLPYYYGKLIEELSQTQTASRSTLFGIGGAWASSQLMFTGMEYIDSKLIPEFESFIRTEFVKVIFDRYSESTGDLETGGILYELTNLPHVLGELAFEIRYRILPAIYVLVAFVGYMFYVNPILGGVALTSMILFLLLLRSVSGGCMGVSLEHSADRVDLHSEIEDKLVNLPSIYSSLSMDHELKDLERLHRKSDGFQTKMILCVAKIKAILNTSYIFIFAAINGVAYYLFKTQKLSIADLSAVMVVVIYAISQLNSVSDSIPNFVHNVGLLYKIQEHLDELRVKESFTSFPESINDYSIEFKGVTIKRGNAKIFDKFDFVIPQNTSLGIVGRVGSGKSTLMYALMKYLDYDGEILIGGKSRDKTTLRRCVSYIPQNLKLFDRTLFDNITYGLGIGKDLATSKIQKVMDYYGLQDIFGKHALDSKVGKGGSALSGGQRQIVFLMRTMLDDSKKIVILDEPTSALDSSSKQKVIDIIADLGKTKTVVCITHDPELMYLFPRILNMDAISRIRD